MSHRRLNALTLIDVLVVVAITAVLVSVLAPALTVAKERAKITADISALHQLGIAGALYNDQFGEFPTGCPTLVSVGSVPKALCGGLADPLIGGSANRLVTLLSPRSMVYHGLVTKYRNSFIGAREIGYSAAMLKETQAQGTRPGWLVDLSSAKQVVPESIIWLGEYRRLCYDSSVITRHAVEHSVMFQGHKAHRQSVTEWFSDHEASVKP